MIVNNAASAREWVADWIANGTDSEQISHFTIAIESSNRSAGICESYGNHQEAMDIREAIGVIRMARYRANQRKGMNTKASSRIG
jgi:hypothetical protein